MSDEPTLKPSPLRARKISISHCDHGSVFIELIDEAGEPFAVAEVDCAVAMLIAGQITSHGHLARAARDKASATKLVLN